VSSPFELSFRCDVPWSSMTELAPGKRRCGSCHREVVDVSALTRRDAQRLIERTDTCISFVVGVDGEPIFRRPPPRTGLAIAASSLLAACSASEPEACELAPEPASYVEAPDEHLLPTDPTAFAGPIAEMGAPVPPVTVSPVTNGGTPDSAVAGDPNDVDGAPAPRRRRARPPVVPPVVRHIRTAGVPMRLGPSVPVVAGPTDPNE
jgi:hypothetical protein